MTRDVVTPDHLTMNTSDSAPPPASAPDDAPLSTLAAMERAHILRALHELHWVKKNVAEALGISRPTLDRKIRLYDLTQDST